MIDAAKKYERVVQVGLQRRSSPAMREACEFIRKGGIGKVTVARAFHVQNEWPKGIGNPPAVTRPRIRLGSLARARAQQALQQERTFYRFRWFYDYSGGQLTNFGVHYLDLIHWALGQDTPLAVTAMGGKYVIEDNREIPTPWRWSGSIPTTRW